MNPTAADYEKAINERVMEYESERSYQGDTLTNAAIKSLRALNARASELAAARQTDSYEKLLADMRSTRFTIDRRALNVFADRLEALGNGGVK